MRIYSVSGADGYELCHPVVQDDFETIYTQVNGESRCATWKPLAMRLIHVDEGRRLVASDSPWLGSHALIFRRRALEALNGVLSENGELLPLRCEEASVFMWNVTRVLDALDEDASNVMRFSNGRLMRIRRHVFRPDVIAQADVFKIRNIRVSPTFVSERFVGAWNRENLKGLAFNPVWEQAVGVNGLEPGRG